MKGDRERFLAAGMDDHITKPLKKKVIEEAIGRIVGL
jgi:CheY-like chemotaxis protein